MNYDKGLEILSKIQDVETAKKILSISKEVTDKLLDIGLTNSGMVLAGEFIAEAIKQIVGDADA